MDKQEKIVCAAIQFRPFICEHDDFGEVTELGGCDYSSIRSSFAYQYMCVTGSSKDEKEGFLTDKNRFVDASEAYKIAVKAKQIPSKYAPDLDILHRIIKAKNSKHYYSTTTIKELEEERERIANKPEILTAEDFY